jgi:hypothetical protein
VSPPWRCNAFATGSAYHGWLTPAAPGCTTFVRSEKRHSRCTNARSQERRDVSPPWRCNAIATGSAYHGWLTPAAPGCTTSVRSEKRHSRCTNARSQERRASARRGGVTHSQRGQRTTAGLRQPLLVARRSFAVKNDIRDAQTHAPKSGGREPAVVWECERWLARVE